MTTPPPSPLMAVNPEVKKLSTTNAAGESSAGSIPVS